MINEYYYLIIFIFIIACILYFIRKFYKFKYAQFNESEITVLMFVLGNIINNYKNTFLEQKYSQLMKKYDLEKNSSTNSKKLFNEEYEQILKDSAKEIITVYFSDDLRRVAFKYFTLDSLLLHIISSLRS